MAGRTCKSGFSLRVFCFCCLVCFLVGSFFCFLAGLVLAIRSEHLHGGSKAERVVKGSRLTWESEGRAVFAGRCFPVRNRSQPSATVRKCSNPAPMVLPLGRALKRDFSWTCRVSVCAAIPL